MNELSRSQFPPGGWQFHQAHTGWSAPTPKSSTFDQTVILIRQHRLNNGAMCVRHNLSTDIAAIGKELEHYTKLRIGMPLTVAAPPPMLLPGVTGGVVGTVSEIKKLAFGSGILIDWSESNQAAVFAGEAETRASKCVTCPLNDRAKYEEWLKMPLAMMLKARITRIDSMALKTTKEPQLGLCTALFSPTHYLVHEPKELITARMKPGKHDPLDEKCWLR